MQRMLNAGREVQHKHMDSGVTKSFESEGERAYRPKELDPPVTQH